MHKYNIREYITSTDKNLFRAWLGSLDRQNKARVQARIYRFESGNLGDSKPVGEGVFEARLKFGPGYRIYFAIVAKNVVLLLLGGDKSSQPKDIIKAKRCLTDYRKRNQEDG